MKHHETLLQLRSELSETVLNAEGASAMGLYDLHTISEGLVLGLLRELWDLPNLRNLNAEERKHYPGIDLADDVRRVAIQVTATSTLDKVKDSIGTFLRHGLDSSYDTLLIYVLTHKQSSYSTRAINALTGERLNFDPDKHVLDFRDLLSKAATQDPNRVSNSLEILRSYKRGTHTATSNSALFDPPAQVEVVEMNLVEIFFPSTLYVADLLSTVQVSQRSGKPPNMRNVIRDYLKLNKLNRPGF